MILRALKDRAFITKALSIGFPIIIQQLLLTTFGIVDTVMVGSISRGVAGVGLASQISMVAGTIIFGINVGVGLYIAQFMGKVEEDNIKRSFSLMLMMCFGIASIFTYLGVFHGEAILRIFSQDQEAIQIANSYLKIAALSYIPNMLSFSFAVAYRNIQKTKVPLMVSIIAMVTNVTLNYFLIFGIWIFPELGIRGAAIATVISTTIGFVFHIIYANITKQIIAPKVHHFFEGLHRSFSMPIIRRTIPFMLNETLFSIGTALYVVIFNRLGTDAYEGYRIAETVVSIMFVVGMGLSTATSAMIGQELGRSNYAKAKEYGDNFLSLGIIVALALGGLNAVLARPLVSIFQNSNPVVIQNAISVMYVFGLRIALRIFVVILFSIFRAGGKSKFVMFIDAGVMWIVGLPMAYISYNYFGITNIATLFLILQLEPIFRILISLTAYFKNTWQANIIQNISVKRSK
ncbi:MAG TPA: MATE family efflux transporter [Bacilli bacterium]|nr:MATE family efflux transporter [Bacilli bacterium]